MQIFYASQSLAGVRITWSPEELAFVKQFFRVLFKSKKPKPPSYPAIRQAQEQYPPLQKRTLAQIKSRVWAMIQQSKGIELINFLTF